MIRTIFFFANGQVAATDENGQQVPEFQKNIQVEYLRDLFRRAAVDAETVIHFGHERLDPFFLRDVVGVLPMPEEHLSVEDARAICGRFALEHKVIFEDDGEVGFGRDCVGFLKGRGYVDLNPVKLDGEYEEIWPRDERLALTRVKDAYHKHDCLAVFVHDENRDEAIVQLAEWVQKLEAQGKLEVAEFKNGARGANMLLHGSFSYALRFKP